MSDSGDDPRDDSYPPGTVLAEATCETCGGRFAAEARETEGHPGERLLEILTRDCLACTELGCRPPECITVGCGGALRGKDYSRHGGAVCFECSICDQQFLVATIRSLLFGRACEEIVTRAVAGLIDGDPTWLLIRKARELKVLP